MKEWRGTDVVRRETGEEGADDKQETRKGRMVGGTVREVGGAYRWLGEWVGGCRPS